MFFASIHTVIKHKKCLKKKERKSNRTRKSSELHISGTRHTIKSNYSIEPLCAWCKESDTNARPKEYLACNLRTNEDRIYRFASARELWTVIVIVFPCACAGRCGRRFSVTLMSRTAGPRGPSRCNWLVSTFISYENERVKNAKRVRPNWRPCHSRRESWTDRSARYRIVDTGDRITLPLNMALSDACSPGWMGHCEPNSRVISDKLMVRA